MSYDADAETGLIMNMSVLRDFKRYARETLPPRQWARLKNALAGMKPGERDEIIMVRHAGMKLLEAVVVAYREELGKVPRVFMAPKFAERLDGGDGLPAIWRNVRVEILSRVGEVQAAAAASGCDAIEVKVIGNGELSTQVRDVVWSMMQTSSGTKVILDGKEVPPKVEMEEYEKAQSCDGLMYTPTIRIALRWKEDDEKLLALFRQHARNLALATPFAWQTRYRGERPAGGWIDFGLGMKVGPVRDFEEVRRAMLRSRMSMPILDKLLYLASLTGRDRPIITGLWWEDRIMALSVILRSAGIRQAGPDLWRVGIQHVPLLLDLSREAQPWPLMEVVAEQVKADLLAMAKSVRRFTERCIIDYAALAFSPPDRQDDYDELLEYMMDGVNEADVEMMDLDAEVGLRRLGASPDDFFKDALFSMGGKRSG